MSANAGGDSFVSTMNATKAKTVYITLVFSAISAIVVLLAVSSMGVVTGSLELPLLPFRIVGLALLIVGFTVGGMMSGGIKPKSADEDATTWWQTNSQKAVLVWMIGEGLAVIAGVSWILVADMLLLVALSVGGLMLLFLNRPQRMIGG